MKLILSFNHVTLTKGINLINHGQIGFKKSSRTDHVFTLKSLINKWC